MPDFTVLDRKIVLCLNTTTKTYVPRCPTAAGYKILFRETSTGPPSIVKYRNKGISIIFASFGADDYQAGYNY